MPYRPLSLTYYYYHTTIIVFFFSSWFIIGFHMHVNKFMSYLYGTTPLINELLYVLPLTRLFSPPN